MGRITKDDRCLIKGLRTEKNGGQTPNKKFPNKRWSVASINRWTKTRQLSYRKEDRAMRPIYRCSQKFWESSPCTRLLFQKFVTDICSDRY